MEGEAVGNSSEAAPQPSTEAVPEANKSSGSILGDSQEVAEESGSILGKSEEAINDEQNVDEAVELSNDQPIEYEDFTLPEGLSPDSESMSEAKEKFKELGLSQEQSQSLVDMNSKIIQQALAAKDQEWLDTTDNWAKAVRSDPEIGGRNYKNTVARAERALAKFDTSGELTDFLVTTQSGNNPAFMKFLVGIDKATSEDSFERGGTSGKPKEISDAEAFYPEQYKREQVYKNL